MAQRAGSQNSPTPLTPAPNASTPTRPGSRTSDTTTSAVVVRRTRVACSVKPFTDAVTIVAAGSTTG